MVMGDEADHHTVCSDCKEELDYGVQQSNAGYYIGTWCPRCGPYGRESGYFRTREGAETALALWDEGERVNDRPRGHQPGDIEVVMVSGDHLFDLLDALAEED